MYDSKLFTEELFFNSRYLFIMFKMGKHVIFTTFLSVIGINPNNHIPKRLSYASMGNLLTMDDFWPLAFCNIVLSYSIIDFIIMIFRN